MLFKNVRQLGVLLPYLCTDLFFVTKVNILIECVCIYWISTAYTLEACTVLYFKMCFVKLLAQ
jgi:hypothetical protein